MKHAKPYNSFRCTLFLTLIFALCLTVSASKAIDVEIGTMDASQIPNTFPELNGISGDEAKATLESKFPSLKVFVVPEDSMVTMDYLEDRVRIFVNKEGRVARVPMIG